ncbi:MAG: cyclic lactone autoinducer peptide [Bacilli bacterium]|nr:cyclic lactone autoinducer peptide [Bacilli bacterium]
MKKLLAMIIGDIGIFVSNTSNMACSLWWVDEPEMPRSMIER